MPHQLKTLLMATASALALSGGWADVARAQHFLIDAPPAARQAEAERAPLQSTPSPVVRRASRLSIKPIDAEEGGPDETALRFYAAHNQPRRVAIELERLRRLYPNWTPPENLGEATLHSGEDEQALWDLFGAEKLDELRAAIAQRTRDEPEWRPSKDLLEKTARKEMRLRLMSMWDGGALAEMIDSVRRDGFGGERADIDLQWTVAEAYARMKQTEEALGIYQSILRTADDPTHRIATIQKAMATLRISDVEQLIAGARVDEAGRSEFASLAIDITRARISAYLHDERSEPLPAAEFAAFEAYARNEQDPNQAGLVAWYYFKMKANREALDWFKLALDRGGDAMVAHGLANVLRDLGMMREAEQVAFAWREPLINNALLFIDTLETQLTQATPPFIEPDRLIRYAQVTMDIASGEGAQALGWYAYNTCQFETAYEWFQRAVAWRPKEDTVLGLMLSARRLKRQRDVFELANRYDGLFPKVLGVIFPDGYVRPPAACDMLASGAKPAPGQQSSARQGAGQMFTDQGFVGAGPAAARSLVMGGAGGGFQQGSIPGAQAGWGQPPLQQVVNDQMPRFARGEFPTAVDPENHRRFPSSGRRMGQPLAVSLPPAGAAPLRAERPRPQPLVARRVSGVGPMPYERWGFSLLPGAGGQQGAGAPHGAQTAVAGTLWADESRAGRAPESAFVDPFALMQAVSAAPRVPAPPGRSAQTPNFMRGANLRPGIDVDMSPVASIGPPAPEETDAIEEADHAVRLESLPAPSLQVGPDDVVRLGAGSPPALLGCARADTESSDLCAAPESAPQPNQSD